MQQTRETQPVAVISGALGDIGQAIALQLASRGVRIALGDIHEETHAAPLLASLRDLHVQARYDRIDVTDAPGVDRWMDNVANDMGTPTIVVPNAATVTLASAMDIAPAEWRRELDINLTGAFLMARAAANHIRKQAVQGSIVFVGSWAADAPHPHLAAYSAAKAGLRMLGRCLALELANDNITVNEVAPGFVDAGLSARIFERDPDARSQAQATVPTGQLIDAQDVAKQVAYLALDASRQMTGATLLVDGGLSLTRRPTPQGGNGRG